MRHFIINRRCMLFGIITFIFLLITALGYYNQKLIINNKSMEERVNMIRENKNYVKIQNIDKKFLKSMIAIEDHRFYNHGALDFISIARATLNNIKARRVVEGGSTITQQLAKNLYLSNERSFKRKFKESLFAIQLERQYTKDEILELYVNSISFGDGYVGIGEAAKGYFEKDASNLSFNEATLLAGLPQAPSLYALSRNNGLAKKRKKQVINALERYNKEVETESVSMVQVEKYTSGINGVVPNL
ncbi:transglycosylase domain-containing protein [Clostridium sardiniense]|uniref:transglycosylase domain-containing protein n=1 Tax=Clostridium sardiniense TaxID=29369 RepID=UPI003D32F72C